MAGNTRINWRRCGLRRSDCACRAQLALGKLAQAERALEVGYSRGYLAYDYERTGQREKAEKLPAEAPSLIPTGRAISNTRSFMQG